MPLHRPHLAFRDAILGRIGESLEGSAAGNAPLLAEFEARIADAVGVPHCVAASNGGVALELAVRGLGLTGEVILPAFMSVSAAHTLYRLGITPVFCDIDSRSWTLDPEKARTLITPRTTGILAAHLWGQPCAAEALESLARDRGLKLLFDARQAFGSAHRGRIVGGFGDAEVFAFDQACPVYACDGAMIATRDIALARRLRILQNLGQDEEGASVCLGIEGKMNPICAAVGLASLERLHDFIEANRRVVARYDLLLTDVPGIMPFTDESLEQRTISQVVIEVDAASAGLGRDALYEVLRAENVEVSRDFYPGAHHIEPYRRANAEAWLRLQATERLAERVLCLPSGAAADDPTIDRICEIVRLAVKHADAIMARLSPPPRAGIAPPAY